MAGSVTVVGWFGFWRLWDGPRGRFLVVHLKAFHNEPSPPDPDRWYVVFGMGVSTGLWNV